MTDELEAVDLSAQVRRKTMPRKMPAPPGPPRKGFGPWFNSLHPSHQQSFVQFFASLIMLCAVLAWHFSS
jgi:hypothetical protein